MTCPSAAKKSCGSHLFGVCPGKADKTALVQDLSKAITFFVLGSILVKFHIRTHFRTLLFFSFTSYPGEIAYFILPNRELSNFVQLMELYWSKIVDPSRSPSLKTVQRKSERGKFSVLRPVVLKNAYSTQLIQSYPREYGWWSCSKEKLSIPL